MINQNKDWVTGDWIQTFTGKQFYPLAPHLSEICIEDIAHSLALQCRYAGHTETFYSVAEHSVRVAMCVEKKYQFAALLHDAAEAYLVDLPRPLKRHSEMGVLYSQIEHNLNKCICLKFGIMEDYFFSDAIRHADNVLLCTEKRDLLKVPPKEWEEKEKPLPAVILPWHWVTAEKTFLEFFKRWER